MKLTRNRDLNDRWGHPTDQDFHSFLDVLTELLKNYQDSRHPSSTRSLTSVLKRHGFVRKDAYKNKPGNWPIIPIWINAEAGIIIKNPLLVSDYAPPVGTRVPTIRVGDYAIQARCDLRTPKAREIACDAFNQDQDCTRFDIHADNIGFFNNNPVLHDW
jgi:hypothetical protein